MSRMLLDQFLAEECTPHVRDLVRAALEEGRGSSAPPKRRFEFNRFEITLDFEEGTALLEDVLDPTEAGSQRMSLEEFRMALS